MNAIEFFNSLKNKIKRISHYNFIVYMYGAGHSLARLSWLDSVALREYQICITSLLRSPFHFIP